LAIFGWPGRIELVEIMETQLRPEVTEEAQQWLTGDLDAINQRVIHICTEEAEKKHLPIKKLRLSVKRSWEEDFRELLLEVFVEANFPQSLVLWEAIDTAIQRWGQKQPPRCRRLLNEKYAVFVEPMLLT
jgi:hypothetical protein